jgi:hypothetical protein
VTPPPAPPTARPPVQPPVVPDAGVAAVQPAGDAGTGRVRPPMQATEACAAVAVHIANIVIASLEDPSMKAAQEQDRPVLIRRVAETCTKDTWSDAARKCFLDGKTAQELEKCGRDLKAPG